MIKIVHNKPYFPRNFNKKKKRIKVKWGVIGEALFYLSLFSLFIWLCFK